MPYTRKGTRARSPVRGRYGRSAPARPARRAGTGRKRVAARAPRASVGRVAPQKVQIELVYRDASTVQRPQVVETTRKGAKPRL